MAKKPKELKLTAKESSERKRLKAIAHILEGVDAGKWTKEEAADLLLKLKAFESGNLK